MSKIKTQWNLDLLEPNNFEKFRKIIQEKVDAFEKKWIKQKNFTKDSKKLKQALDEYEKILHYIYPSNEQTYYMLFESVDLQNQEIKAKLKLASDFIEKISIKLQPFGNLIARTPKRYQAKLLNSSELKKYKTSLEESFRNAKYRLSNKEERVIIKLSDYAYSGWDRMVESLVNSEKVVLKTNKQKVSISELSKYFEDKDQKTREAAAIAQNEIVSKFEPVAEHEMNNIIGYRKSIDELRKTKRRDELRHASDGVDSEVVDQMLSVVRSNTTIPQSYYAWKKKELGLKKMYYFDRKASLEVNDKNVNFDEAYTLAKKFFNKLDPELGDIFEDFFIQGKVDVFPKAGKRSGAFCMTSSYKAPVYILLNYTDKISYLRTIVHEFGHAINSELSRRQPPIYFDYGMATAETASTLFEYLFVDFLKEELGDKSVNDIAVSSIEDILATVFRQAAFYDFETEMHKNYSEKGYLSSKEISEMFYKNVYRDFGGEIIFDDYSKNSWIYIGHFRSYFYVYSYVFGCLSSLAISQKYKNGELSMKEVKTFLGLGNSKTPKDMFATIGIDISQKSFWENGVRRIGEMVEGLVV